MCHLTFMQMCIVWAWLQQDLYKKKAFVIFVFLALVLILLVALLPWVCLCKEHTHDCSSALFLCQFSFPDFIQRHERCVHVVWGFVWVLAAVRGQSSRHNRSQQMSLYPFLALFLSFVSAVCRWSSPTDTDGGWIKQENNSSVAQSFAVLMTYAPF